MTEEEIDARFALLCLEKDYLIPIIKYISKEYVVNCKEMFINKILKCKGYDIFEFYHFTFLLRPSNVMIISLVYFNDKAVHYKSYEDFFTIMESIR